MKINVMLNAAECNAITNNATEIADVLNYDQSKLNQEFDTIRDAYNHNNIRYFAGGQVALAHTGDDYIAELSVENDAMVELINGFAKVLLMVWPVIAPFLTLPGTLKALRKTMKENVAAAFSGFTGKYEKPTTYSVAGMAVSEIDMYGAVLVEIDGYGNNPQVIASKTIVIDGNGHFDDQVMLRAWAKAEGQDTRLDGITTREDAEIAFEKTWKAITHAYGRHSDRIAKSPVASETKDESVAKPLVIFRKDTHEQVYPFQKNDGNTTEPSCDDGVEMYATITVNDSYFGLLAFIVSRLNGEYKLIQTNHGTMLDIVTNDVIAKMVEDLEPVWVENFWTAKNEYDEVVENGQN